MKRVKAACLLQTLHFQLKEDIDHDIAVRAVREDVAHYKTQLERNRTAFKIDEETVQPDGSIIVKIRKLYNAVNTGSYLD